MQLRSNDESGLNAQNIHESVSRESEDVLDLPPRREVHKRASRSNAARNEPKDRKKKKSRIRFPLVRIWLFLFLVLVSLMVAYPVWLGQ